MTIKYVKNTLFDRSLIKLCEPCVRIIFYEINLALKHVLFPCPIQVNNSLLPTRVLTSYQINTVVFRMILIYDIVFGLVYNDHCQAIKSMEIQFLTNINRFCVYGNHLFLIFSYSLKAFR